MKGCLVALGIVAGLVVAGIVFFTVIYPTIHVRYRLTVEVEDGDQIKSASSVIDVSYAIYPDNFINLGGPDTHPRRVGYAPTVDLGTKGLLFLTFVDPARTPEQRIASHKQISCPLDDIGCLIFAAYKPGAVVGLAYSLQRDALHDVLRQKGPRELPFAVLPKLVRFSDINDSRTLVAVSPNDLAASFGPRVRLKRVTLELTDDPITPPPEIWPQWLKVKGHNTIFRGYENG